MSIHTILSQMEEFDWKKWDEIVEEYDDMFCHWDEFKKEVALFYSSIATRIVEEAQREERERILKTIQELKGKHDVESDDAGAFSTCNICGDANGEYCNTEYNQTLDIVLDEVTNLQKMKGDI